MSTHAFADVLLRRDGSRTEDTGNLTIAQDSIWYDGSAEQLTITNVQFVSLTRLSLFSGSNWVKVEYGSGFEPSVVYFKDKQDSSGAARIFTAMQHFSNSGQFECAVWTSGNASRRLLRPAPRKPGGFAKIQKGSIATTRIDTVTLTAPFLVKREAPLTDIEGYMRELLTARQQFISKLLEWLMVSAAVGVIITLAIFILQQGKAEMSLADTFINLFVIFVGSVVLVMVIGMLDSISTLLRARTVDLFTLKTRSGSQWDFGVAPQQAEQVAKTLKSWGIRATM